MINLTTYLNKNNRRVIGLDIVRTAAILLVLFRHAGFLLKENVRGIYLSFIPSLDGVSLFFVLSGFLIGGILLKTIRQTSFTMGDLLQFWVRRWFRTLPNYLFVLLLIAGIGMLLNMNMKGFGISYFFFTQNLYQYHPPFFSEAWSLSVEEWFYLSFPVLILIMLRLTGVKTRAVIFAATFFLVIPFLLRLVFYLMGVNLGDIEQFYRKIVMFRIDALMYGVFGAYISMYKKETWIKYRKLCLWIGLAIIAMLTFAEKIGYKNTFFEAVIGFNFESVASLLLLPYFSTLKQIRSRYASALFVFTSTTSYSMYLLNYSLIIGIIIPFLTETLGLQNIYWKYLVLFQYAAYWLLVVMLSYVVYRYFEKPMTELRDRFGDKKEVVGVNIVS